MCFYHKNFVFGSKELCILIKEILYFNCIEYVFRFTLVCDMFTCCLWNGSRKTCVSFDMCCESDYKMYVLWTKYYVFRSYKMCCNWHYYVIILTSCMINITLFVNRSQKKCGPTKKYVVWVHKVCENNFWPTCKWEKYHKIMWSVSQSMWYGDK
jgi:hypothetical protein